jgi:hypothetical protein
MRSVRRSSGDTHRRTFGDELHHLMEVEAEGDSPLTALIVVGQVLIVVFVAVSVLLVVTFAFYFGWL